MTLARTRLRGCAVLVCSLLPWAFQGCGDPIAPEHKETYIHHDPIDTTVHNGPATDSISAFVHDREILFVARPRRPIFYNGEVGGRQYLTAEVWREGENGADFDIIFLRLDAVSDTGVYRINAPYSAPRNGIDTLARPEVGAAYWHRIDGGTPEIYTTDADRPRGEIHVDRIDRKNRMLYGTFWFVAFTPKYQDSVVVDRGTFRLGLR